MTNNLSSLKKNSLQGRSFILLQGPQSYFFIELANALVFCGASVVKVNFCGGDVLIWQSHKKDDAIVSVNYHDRACNFPLFIKELYDKHKATDLVVYSDWRPMHQDAILVAKSLAINIWVYEEGYLRSGFVTLEKNGVNGRSSIPKKASVIQELAQTCPSFTPSRLTLQHDSIYNKVRFAILHHFGNVVLFPAFAFYRTHRAHNILFELIGILPRYLNRKNRRSRSSQSLKAFLKDKRPFFFYPLQLKDDSQVQLYSPYIRQEEAITAIISSFAKNAPKDSRLLIKNHPLDNGLIPYRNYIEKMAQALGCGGRVCYIEDGNSNFLIKKSCGVVLINSTVGLSALLQRKKVFCLGYAVYGIKGLAHSFLYQNLDDFWTSNEPFNEQLFNDFCAVIKAKALIEGDFYTARGVRWAALNSIERFKEAACATANK